MTRAILTLIMISSLLACPFDCMSGPEPAAPSTVTARRCTCCYRDGKVAEPSPTGQQERQESGRCDCICAGAVRVDNVSIELDEPLWVAFVLDVGTFAATERGRIHRADASIDEGISVKPGRALRLAIHSLQI